MKPSKKAPEIDKLLTSISGIDRKKTITENRCAYNCENPNMNFRDAVSKEEYTRSELCQNCQDELFGKD